MTGFRPKEHYLAQRSAPTRLGHPMETESDPVSEWNQSSLKLILRGDETDFQFVLSVLFVLFVL